MRIGARLLLTNDSWDACNMNGFGEYEDYCINFIPRCVDVDSLSAIVDSTTEEVILQWAGNPNATYEYGYKLEGDSVWTSLEADSNYVAISPDSLFGCSVYNFRVKLNCVGEASNFALSDSIKTICAVGVDRLLEQDIRLYPNPAREQLRIEAPVALDGISLVNVVGQEILRKELNSNKTSIRLDEVPSGVYFLKLRAGEQEVWKRVLIDK